MVVLAILALAAAAVVLTIPGEEQHVRSEADRLAARLAAARDIAVIEGRSVAVDLAPSGYGFARRIDGAWGPLPGRAFERRSWPSDVGWKRPRLNSSHSIAYRMAASALHKKRP